VVKEAPVGKVDKGKGRVNYRDPNIKTILKEDEDHRQRTHKA